MHYEASMTSMRYHRIDRLLTLDYKQIKNPVKVKFLNFFTLLDVHGIIPPDFCTEVLFFCPADCFRSSTSCPI